MADIGHQITIDAKPESVFDAVTTREGLTSWWTADADAEPREGAEAVFRFAGGKVQFRMRIDALDAPRRVAWTCLGDVDEWAGTTLLFEVEPMDEGTTLRFTHAGWRSVEGAYRVCNTDWGRLMYYLKDYAEGHRTGPMMG